MSAAVTNVGNDVRLDELEQDYQDDQQRGEWLPSFTDIKFKTQQTLYEGLSISSFRDKSPKGSVDERIRPLVDLINQHESFSTLSSCSGRISLFDPNNNNRVRSNQDSIEEPGLPENSVSGKGIGGWLLVSHEEIEPDELTSLFPEQSVSESQQSHQESYETHPLVFKVEPLLLHVAAASLKRGRQLLAIALALGFRESGLVVSDSRVTVHVRGQSLALCVPLAKSGALCPPQQFLISLVDQANLRMRQNLDKLNRLYNSVLEGLFRPPEQRRASCDLHVQNSMIPNLNLFGMGLVAISRPDGSISAYSFGGYGQGPFLAKANARSNQVLVLNRNAERVWDQEWKTVSLNTKHSSELQPKWKGLPMGHDSLGFPFCQSVQACKLSDWIMIFGGRTSPSNPLGTVYFFDHDNSLLASPSDVRGTPPSPRWGHTLTTLSKDCAVVVGGCTSEGLVDMDLHIFSVVQDSETPHFLWETVQTDCVPRCHHTTIFHNHRIFLFGGLGSTSHVLDHGVPCWTGDVSLVKGSWTLKDSDTVEYETPLGFGCAGISIKEPQSASKGDGTMILLSGGVSNRHGDSHHISPIQCYSIDRHQVMSKVQTQMKLLSSSDEELDFGSMVHHQCLSVGDSEFLLLGGGVSSFAFGYSFAR